MFRSINLAVVTLGVLLCVSLSGARSASAQDRVSSATKAASAPTIKPGTYDLTLVYGGGTLPATLEIRAIADSLVAKLSVGDHESPVRAGERKGNLLALVSTSAGTQVHYDLDFDGETVKGTFSFNGEPGTLTGKRRPPTP